MGEEVVGDFGTTYHIDESLVDVAYFVGRAPKRTAARSHGVVVEDFPECAFIIIGTEARGKHEVVGAGIEA